MFYNLKALIKAIRATKTIADERALIIKESATIRTAFKEEGECISSTVVARASTGGGRPRTQHETRKVDVHAHADLRVSLWSSLAPLVGTLDCWIG